MCKVQVLTTSIKGKAAGAGDYLGGGGRSLLFGLGDPASLRVPSPDLRVTDLRELSRIPHGPLSSPVCAHIHMCMYMSLHIYVCICASVCMYSHLHMYI